MSVITLKSVDKYYNDYHALKNISLDVKKGQIYSYLGPNGFWKDYYNKNNIRPS